jgi:hypothetical protein
MSQLGAAIQHSIKRVIALLHSGVSAAIATWAQIAAQEKTAKRHYVKMAALP